MKLQVFVYSNVSSRNQELINSFNQYIDIHSNIDNNIDIHKIDVIITEIPIRTIDTIPCILLKEKYIENHCLLEKSFFIETQVKFRYGKWYDIIKEKKVFDNDEMSLPYNIEYDSSIAKFIITDKYTTTKPYRQDRLQKMLDIFLNYNVAKDNLFYVNMDDCILYEECMIAHNRRHNDMTIILYPLPYYHEALINTKDTISFHRKLPGVIWRGTRNTFPKRQNRALFIRNTFNCHKDIDIGYSEYDMKRFTTENDHIYFKNKVSQQDQMKYKFILNLEGNDWSTSFLWSLASNCCPLHTFPFTFESVIFGNGLKEWVHFVPIAIDGSDLVEKYNWCMANLDKCEEIATNGKKYMKYYQDSEIYKLIMKRFFDIYPLKKLAKCTS